MGRRLCRVSIVGILLGTALACSAERSPESEPDEASSRSGGCTEKRAIESARGVTREYCSGTNGCDFNARLAESASDGQDASEKWIVIVSLIHSFDEAGQPRFMPEGARIVRVSTGCEPTRMLGHGGLIAIPDP